jgi:hypothetical protein
MQPRKSGINTAGGATSSGTGAKGAGADMMAQLSKALLNRRRVVASASISGPNATSPTAAPAPASSPLANLIAKRFVAQKAATLTTPIVDAPNKEEVIWD